MTFKAAAATRPPAQDADALSKCQTILWALSVASPVLGKGRAWEWNEFLWLIANNVAARRAGKHLRLSIDCNSIHFVEQIPHRMQLIKLY